jgi:hypothetical protein
MTRVSPGPASGVRFVAALLLVLAALAGASSLAGCDSSGTTTSGASPATATAVAITAGLPQDAATEPPWNGRFVQVTVRAPKPAALAASDWSVSVNGKEQPLEKPPDIHPYEADAATVVFIFQAPFGDLGKTYRFRVVYSPPNGPTVKRSWDYDWTP